MGTGNDTKGLYLTVMYILSRLASDVTEMRADLFCYVNNRLDFVLIRHSNFSCCMPLVFYLFLFIWESQSGERPFFELSTQIWYHVLLLNYSVVYPFFVSLLFFKTELIFSWN